MIYDRNTEIDDLTDKFDELGGRWDLTFQHFPCFCGENDGDIVSTTTRHGTPTMVFQCRQCGTLRINPYLTEESVGIYYREIYGPVKRKGAEPDALYSAQAKTSKKLFDTVKPFLSDGCKIIDYGSGSGGRLDAFRDQGYDLRITDLDTYYLQEGEKRGYTALAEGETGDFLILSHVLEHINDPIAFAATLKDLLSPGGLFYVEVPYIDNERKLLTQFHISHKWYFSQLTCQFVLQAAGYEVVEQLKGGVLVRPAAEGTTAAAPRYAEAKAVSDEAVKLSTKRRKYVRLMQALGLKKK